LEFFKGNGKNFQVDGGKKGGDEKTLLNLKELFSK
jgi:hypothetical protein